MERVKKGEKYWSILFDRLFNDDGFCVMWHCEDLEDDVFSEIRFKQHNYFHTKEEAEAMANKFRAVLKGADVIEMPSEDEFNKQIKEIGVDKQNIELCKNDSISLSLMFGALQMLNWLKSKIVK